MEGGDSNHGNQRRPRRTGKAAQKRRYKRRSQYRIKLIHTEDGIIEVRVKRKSKRRRRKRVCFLKFNITN